VKAPERARFDALLEAVMTRLPPELLGLLDEVAVIVEDRPSRELLDELGEDASDLLGLHTGTPFTEQGVDFTETPPTIHLFREGIVDHAGGWEAGDDAVRTEIRITLLHEIGHQFGLDEDDLERLGYD